MRNLILPALAAATVLAGLAVPAPAAIRCNDAYQINSLGEFHSPYCEDGYLATVAHTFGMRVTGNQIRNDYGLKAEVCRAIGFDSRILEICAPYRSRNRNGRCRVLPCF